MNQIIVVTFEGNRTLLNSVLLLYTYFIQLLMKFARILNGWFGRTHSPLVRVNSQLSSEIVSFVNYLFEINKTSITQWNCTTL